MSESPTREIGFDGRQPRAVNNALDILDVVARSGPGVTAREVCAQVDATRATVYRVLNHLVAEEYLIRSPDLRGFALGRRMHELGRHLARYHESTPAAQERIEDRIDAGRTDEKRPGTV